MSAQQLITSANGLQLISDKTTADQVIILLLNLVAGGGGGGTTTGTITFGAYGVGNQPNFTPASGVGAAYNTDDGRLWWYYNGQWQ